jgi:hypothetical protein
MKTAFACIIGVFFLALSMMSESSHEHGGKQLYETVACGGDCQQCNLGDAKNC